MLRTHLLLIPVITLLSHSYVYAETVETKTDPIQQEGTNAQNNTPAQPVENRGGLGFTIGYSHNFVSAFDIDNPNATDEENKNRARFTGATSSPYLTITTGNLAPNDLHWQLIVEMGYSEFELDTQEYDGIKQNYGTSVKGSHTYIMPQIIYNTSPVGTHPNLETGFRLGGGLGIGRLKAKGTVRYTDRETRESDEPDAIHVIDLDETGLSLKLLAEYRAYGFMAGITAKIVMVEGKDENGTASNYANVDAGINMGYSIHF